MPESPFTLTGQEWNRLPESFATARRVGSLAVNLPVVAALTLAAWLIPIPLPLWRVAVVAGLGLAWAGWRLVRAGRWARAFGYLEREDDLMVVSGLWWKKVSAIPYGRMQSVEVSTGPLQRIWGLAQVSLVTASVESNATVPGLLHAEATGLRDRLIAAGEDQALPL